jgi:hypothetical protein
MEASGTGSEQREELVAGKSERSVPRTSGPLPHGFGGLRLTSPPFYHVTCTARIDR